MSSQSGTFRRRLGVAAIVALAILAVPAAGAAFLYSGVYDIGADAPHTKPVFWLLDTFRDRSVEAHAQGLTPPGDLADPARLTRGGHLYAELCTSCHLAPGMARTDLSRGLYPKAPQLAYGTDLSPAAEFWIIKHGVKLSAMPSWGRTHKDDEIWDLVAFLKQLPDLQPDQYQAATGALDAGAAVRGAAVSRPESLGTPDRTASAPPPASGR
jgi:mono/diheme cytochrome c family protein